VPTDLEQATGLERLEILGKMQGIDVFDLKPLPSDRRGMSSPLCIFCSVYSSCAVCPVDSAPCLLHILPTAMETRPCNDVPLIQDQQALLKIPLS